MSGLQSPSLLRALLSPDYLGRAMRALDRATLVIIGVVWLGSILMMGIAIYTAVKAGKARQQTEEAAAVEPIVPQTSRAVVPRAELEKLADRLRNRFDKVSFNAMPDNTLEIVSSEAGVYLDWLAAMSYLDTIAPQVRWAIRDLCVGSECGGALMRAAVTGERVTFKMPEILKPETGAEGQKS